MTLFTAPRALSAEYLTTQCVVRSQGAGRQRSFSVKSLLMIACLSPLLASCDLSREEQLVSYGIGRDLHHSNARQNTINLDAYLGYLCNQAGLASKWPAQGEPYCEDHTFTQRDWTLLVHTGFNDIDQRCDSYLAWLANKRRRRPAILAQITNTRDFVAALMTAAGDTGTPLAVVGQAFGFVSKSFTNYHSRLLLEIESSTVETLVLERRAQVRESLRNTSYFFKPDVIYVLRSYLRLCMPFAIEAGINSVSRHGIIRSIAPQAESAERIAPHLISRSRGIVTGAIRQPGPSGRRRPIAPTEPLPPTQPDPTCQVVGAKENTDECQMTKVDIEKLQNNLCVGPADGIIGENTRRGLNIYEWMNPNSTTANRTIEESELQRIHDLGKCPAGLLNYYERLTVQRQVTNGAQIALQPDDTVEAAFVELLREALLALPEVRNEVVTTTKLKDLRKAIAAANKKFAAEDSTFKSDLAQWAGQDGDYAGLSEMLVGKLNLD